MHHCVPIYVQFSIYQNGDFSALGWILKYARARLCDNTDAIKTQYNFQLCNAKIWLRLSRQFGYLPKITKILEFENGGVI